MAGIGFKPGAGRGRIVGGKANARVIGLKSLLNTFKKLEKSDSVVTRMIHQGANSWAKRAVRDVPVDIGKLLKSIKPTFLRRGAVIDVDANYAGYVDKGTKFQNAQPYFEKHQERIVNMILKNIKDNLI